MTQQPLPESVQAHIEGEISGQVAVGNHILQIGSVHGGVVNVAAPQEQPRPRPRAVPVRLLPRPFANLVGRQDEIEAAVEALGASQPTQLHGEEGIGKTVLLRRLAHTQPADLFPDGTV